MTFDWSEGFRRFMAASQGIPDRVPIIAQVTEHAMHLTGTPAERFFKDPSALVKAELAVSKYYGFDMPFLVYDAYNIEAEALGSVLSFRDMQMPELNYQEPLIKEPADLESLVPPEPGISGRMPYVLEAMDIYKEETGFIPMAIFCAPFSLAVAMRGYGKLIRDFRRNPEFANSLFAFLVEEVLSPWIRALFKRFPEAGSAAGTDAWGSPPNVTLDIINDYILKYVLKLRDEHKSVWSRGYFGESSFANPESFMELKIKLGGRTYQAFDPDVARLGPKLFKDFTVAKGIPLTIGLDARFLRDGPITALVERVQNYIQVAAPGGNFIFYLANIPADTPPAHVHAVVEAVRTFGKYPLEEHDSGVLSLKQRESFSSFAAKAGISFKS